MTTTTRGHHRLYSPPDLHAHNDHGEHGGKVQVNRENPRTMERGRIQYCESVAVQTRRDRDRVRVENSQARGMVGWWETRSDDCTRVGCTYFDRDIDRQSLSLAAWHRLLTGDRPSGEIAA